MGLLGGSWALWLNILLMTRNDPYSHVDSRFGNMSNKHTYAQINTQRHCFCSLSKNWFYTLSTNHPAEEPLLLWPMVIFLIFPKFGASIVNLSSVPLSKLFLSLSNLLSPLENIAGKSSFTLKSRLGIWLLILRPNRISINYSALQMYSPPLTFYVFTFQPVL